MQLYQSYPKSQNVHEPRVMVINEDSQNREKVYMPLLKPVNLAGADNLQI